MNKYLFIGIVIVIITLVVGVWIYLIFNGTPSGTKDIFTNWNFSEPAPERPAVILETPEVTVDTNSQKLNQLTTRPVAGYVAVNTASSSIVRYAEKGTGHVYQIDLDTGSEERISGTTLSRVVEAVFGSQGENIVLITETGYTQQAYVLNITASSSAELMELPANTTNHQFEDGSLFYTTKEEEGQTVGYSFDMTSATSERLFTIPLTDINVIRQDNTTYLINRPAQRLRGSVYQLDLSGQYQKISGPSYGLTASSDIPGQWLISRIETDKQEYRSYHLDAGSGEENPLAIVTVPEKCVQTTINTTWCVLPYLGTTPVTYLSHWYQGVMSYDDLIWKVDNNSGEAVLELTISGTTGFEIDAEQVTASPDKLFFTNRHNDSLWSYDIQ